MSPHDSHTHAINAHRNAISPSESITVGSTNLCHSIGRG